MLPIKPKTSNFFRCGILILPLLISTSAFAGGEGNIGNGGGAWVCQNNDSLGTIRWAKLVDLYEGRTEFNLEIPEIKNRDYLEIVNTVMEHRLLPVSENLYTAINESLESVKTNLVMVDADLEIVDDALYRIRPSKKECVGGTISYLQLANFTHYGKILVQKNIFEDPHPSGTDKAALMIHEAVYAYLRKQRGDTDSVRARRIVGLLFSTIPQSDLKKAIEETMSGGLNATGMEFVHVRPGSFVMGCSDDEAVQFQQSCDLPHTVQITKAFDIQTTPVTQKQYFDIMGLNPSFFKYTEHCPKTFTVIRGTPLCPNNPVERVSYHDAHIFLARKNATRGEYIYRLPTEAEWEFAARAGTSTAYSFGSDRNQIYLYGWITENSGNQTHEVAQLWPNSLGLYDIHGNVLQWVEDWYGPYSSDAQIDPTGPSRGWYGVVRGGHWEGHSQDVRSAARKKYLQNGSEVNIGFRIVRVLNH